MAVPLAVVLTQAYLKFKADSLGAAAPPDSGGASLEDYMNFGK